MNKNFTQLAFSKSVKKQQEKYGTRTSYSRMESRLNAFELGLKEIEFIQSRDSFYISTVGENGWPYVQHRGGPKGFVYVLNKTSLVFADFRGNGQYISSGNLHSSNKTMLILMNYPSQQRLKIWAESSIIERESDSDLETLLKAKNSTTPVERFIKLKVQAFDWNCSQHITPRYTEDEISRMQHGVL